MVALKAHIMYGFYCYGFFHLEDRCYGWIIIIIFIVIINNNNMMDGWMICLPIYIFKLLILRHSQSSRNDYQTCASWFLVLLRYFSICVYFNMISSLKMNKNEIQLITLSPEIESNRIFSVLRSVRYVLLRISSMFLC